MAPAPSMLIGSRFGLMRTYLPLDTGGLGFNHSYADGTTAGKVEANRDIYRVEPPLQRGLGSWQRVPSGPPFSNRACARRRGRIPPLLPALAEHDHRDRRRTDGVQGDRPSFSRSITCTIRSAPAPPAGGHPAGRQHRRAQYALPVLPVDIDAVLDRVATRTTLRARNGRRRPAPGDQRRLASAAEGGPLEHRRVGAISSSEMRRRTSSKLP